MADIYSNASLQSLRIGGIPVPELIPTPDLPHFELPNEGIEYILAIEKALSAGLGFAAINNKFRAKPLHRVLTSGELLIDVKTGMPYWTGDKYNIQYVEDESGAPIVTSINTTLGDERKNMVLEFYNGLEDYVLRINQENAEGSVRRFEAEYIDYLPNDWDYSRPLSKFRLWLDLPGSGGKISRHNITIDVKEGGAYDHTEDGFENLKVVKRSGKEKSSGMNQSITSTVKWRIRGGFNLSMIRNFTDNRIIISILGNGIGLNVIEGRSVVHLPSDLFIKLPFSPDDIDANSHVEPDRIVRSILSYGPKSIDVSMSALAKSLSRMMKAT